VEDLSDGRTTTARARTGLAFRLRVLLWRSYSTLSTKGWAPTSTPSSSISTRIHPRLRSLIVSGTTVSLNCCQVCLFNVNTPVADNEDGLCPFQGVAIVSHGAKRTMKFKCKLTGALAKEVELLPYSILHMKGKSFQKVWLFIVICCMAKD